MHIRKIGIKEQIGRKIYVKHGILYHEISGMLQDDEPVFFRAQKDRYMAIGLFHRYLTVIFTLEDGQANVITAYSSPPWQKRLHKAKK